MSRGASSSEACEPNLTPLLDLVLQILMFFMVTVNFATEQNNADVELPFSQSARPLPKKGDKDPIFVNLLYDRSSREYKILVLGKAPMSPPEADIWIRGQADDQKRDYNKIISPMIIRAHKDAEYVSIYKLLRSCSEAGFHDLKVRAIVLK
jgi:biopolymer transport protein ExbD